MCFDLGSNLKGGRLNLGWVGTRNLTRKRKKKKIVRGRGSMGMSRQRVRVERFREFEVELSCLICVKHFVLEANESPNQVVNDEVLRIKRLWSKKI